EPAVIVLEDPNRPPFARHDKLRKTVPIQVRENRAADKPQRRPFLRQLELPALVAKQPRWRGLRVTTRDDAPAHEQIEIPIPIDVRKRQRPWTRPKVRQRFASRQPAAKLESTRGRQIRIARLVIRLPDPKCRRAR